MGSNESSCLFSSEYVDSEVCRENDVNKKVDEWSFISASTSSDGRLENISSETIYYLCHIILEKP
jgi:hypothetical protein